MEADAAKGELTMAYLLSYNFAMAFGWLAVVYAAVLALVIGVPPQEVYDQVGTTPVAYLLAVSFMEVFHAATGLVKGGPVEAFLQCAGRAIMYFGVAMQQPASQSTVMYPILLVAWGLSECIRYPFYLAQTMNNCPRGLMWLRYSAFLVLYPVGFFAEVAVVLPGFWLMENNLGLPAVIPFATNSQIVMGLYLAWAYLVGAPRLYFHMLRRRAAKLRPKTE